MIKKLPTVNSPTMVCTLPVSGKKVKYRPFVVKEQKALLLAQSSEDDETIRETVKDVMNSCSNGTIGYDTIPVADLTYFFLQLRIAAVGNEVRVMIPCQSCEEKLPVTIDLASVTLDTSKMYNNVMITDEIGIIFHYPSIEESYKIDSFVKGSQGVETIKLLMDSIFDSESVYPKADHTDQELDEWIESLNDQQIEKISDWVDTIPELSHKLEYTCPHCKTKNSRLLEGLHAFFRLGDDA